MRELLETLCALPGVSGWEDAVRDTLRSLAEPFADEILEDSMGNLMVYRKAAQPTETTIMLCAHMDEVGLLVKSITDEGYLKFVTVGGIDRRAFLGHRVLVGKSAIPGVVGLKAIHLSTPEERKKLPKIEDMYIDAGFASREEAEKQVRPGDYITFDTDQFDYGDGMWKSKAIDDRVGCAVLAKLLEQRYACNVWYAFTTQEEIGTRGALTASYRLAPSMAVVVEGTTAADLPHLPPHCQVCRPGAGVVIPFMDGGTVYDKTVAGALRESAERLGLPWQTKEYVSGGTDAAAIQRSLAGCKVAGIALAVRYIHTPASAIKLEEADQLLRILTSFLALPHD